MRTLWWALMWSAVVSVAAIVLSSMVDVAPSPLWIAAQGAIGPLLAVLVSIAVVAIYRRRPHLWRAAAVTAAVVVADLAAGMVSALPYRAEADTPVLTVTSVNLLWENANIAAAVQELVDAAPDVLVTVETFAPFEPVITAAFDGNLVPAARQPGTSTPVVIWTRPTVRVVHTELLTATKMPVVTIATADGVYIDIVGVHTESPDHGSDIALWRAQLADLADVAGRGVPTVFAGDFNASLSHYSMRMLLNHAGDAARAAGRWWSPSWPTMSVRSVRQRSPVRVLDLDHILVTKPLTVASFTQETVTGSDHQALTAVLTMSG